MTDKEVWKRPATVSLYDHILFKVMVNMKLANIKEVARWMACPGNSTGYSPFFLDYCNYICNTVDDPDNVVEF